MIRECFLWLATLFAFWFHFGLKIHFKLLPLYLSRPFDINGITKWLFKSKSDDQVQPRQFNSQDRKVFKIGPLHVLMSIVFLFAIPAIISHMIWKAQHENVFVSVELSINGENSTIVDTDIVGNETAASDED
jgi:hypothetical protein